MLSIFLFWTLVVLWVPAITASPTLSSYQARISLLIHLPFLAFQFWPGTDPSSQGPCQGASILSQPAWPPSPNN